MIARTMLFAALFGSVISFSPTPVTIREAQLAELEAKMTRAAVNVNGNGTGWAFRQDELMTYFFTADHVVENDTDVTIHSYRDGYFHSRPGKVIRHNPKDDLAIIAVQSLDYDVMEIMSDFEYFDQVAPGRLLLAAGWPRTTPALVTLGTVRDPRYAHPDSGPYLYHSTGGWFGYSGGPVVLGATGKVCGLTVRIRSSENNGYDCTRMLAVPAPILNQFVRSIWEK